MATAAGEILDKRRGGRDARGGTVPPICHFLSFPTSSIPRFQCSPPCNVLDLEMRSESSAANSALFEFGGGRGGMNLHVGVAPLNDYRRVCSDSSFPGAERGRIYSLSRRGVCLRRLLMMQFTLSVRWTSVCLMLRRRCGFVVRPQIRPTTDSLPPSILSLLSRGAATLVLQRRALFINLRSIPL